MTQEYRVLTKCEYFITQSYTFSQYKLDDNVDKVINVMDNDTREYLKTWSYDNKLKILNVNGKFAILTVLIEKQFNI